LYMVNSLNFTDILRSCKENYIPFEGTITKERQPKSLIDHILSTKKAGLNPVIAEIKPASPTAGTLRRVDDVAALASSFKQNGACGVSVLTETRFFGGSLENLSRANCGLPVLRKDFLFHPSQITESYAYGADSILLISSFFSEDTLAAMLYEARALGMEPLVEVHGKEDIERAGSAGARLYAINNRDKDTLKVDLKRTARLAPLVDGIRVSASGIETPAQLKDVLGYCDAALIGSALMKAGDPGTALRALVYGGQ
jgi:indole-3-glycerol phosphate synthase